MVMMRCAPRTTSPIYLSPFPSSTANVHETNSYDTHFTFQFRVILAAVSMAGIQPTIPIN